MKNIRQDYNKDLPIILKEFFDQKQTQAYGDVYIGTVVNNNDPQKLGRCQIRVYGIYSNEIIDDDLPWALPEFGFIGSEVGSFIVPPNDCIVSVRFSNNDVNEPIYTTKVLKKGKLPNDIGSDYPNTLVFFELDGGDKFTINRNTGETIYTSRNGIVITMFEDKSFKLEHSKGTILEIDKSGNVDISSGNKTPTSQITIKPGAAGSIKMGNNPLVPCPDLLTCVVTGAPLGINTSIPGNQITIP